jgi:hypothetical protein
VDDQEMFEQPTTYTVTILRGNRTLTVTLSAGEAHLIFHCPSAGFVSLRQL